MKMPDEKYDLTLPEKALLLSLNDNGWSGRSENSIKFAIPAVILYELIRLGRIALDHGIVHITNPKPTGDPNLDKVLDRIISAGEFRNAADCIRLIAYGKLKLRRRILAGLINKKILAKEEYRILRVFVFKKFPLLNKDLKRNLQQDLHDRILKDPGLLPSDLMLLSVMSICGMIRKNLRHLSRYRDVKRKARTLLKFKEPGNQAVLGIKDLHDSLAGVVWASRVTIPD